MSGGLPEDQGLLCQFCKDTRVAAYNFAIQNALEGLLKDQKVNEKQIIKPAVTIGMLPSNMIVQYMENFYLKSFPFYLKGGNKSINGCLLKDTVDSFLNEKHLVIKLKKEIQYTQVMAQLTNKPLTY